MRIGAVLAVAAAAALIAWFFIDRSNDSSTDTTSTPTLPVTTPPTETGATHIGPATFSQNDLAQLSQSIGQPIYWAGPKPGFKYEITETTSGKVYVRYLPSGVKAGDPRANFLIIATYPFPNAFNALKKVAKGHGVALPANGLAVVDQAYRKSVHLAFRGVNFQVEVYSPSPAQARRTAVSGDVQPVR